MDSIAESFAASFAGSLILPAAVLALLGFVLPKLLARLFGEGVRALVLVSVASSLLMLGLSATMFFLMTLWRGLPLTAMRELGSGAMVLHFLGVGLLSALLWGPLMALSISTLPRKWKESTW